MPIHNWKCEGCGEEVEEQRRIGDHARPPSKSCKKCEETRWSKFLPSAPSMERGPGWRGAKGDW